MQEDSPTASAQGKCAYIPKRVTWSCPVLMGQQQPGFVTVLPHCYSKTLDQSDFYEDGLIWAHNLRVQSFMVGKVRVTRV